MPHATRTYGDPPYSIVLVHGGPGATGDLAPLARELAMRFGVLEPLQTARSLKGQIKELYRQIQVFTDGPVVLIGHSWGAWLVMLCAIRHPELARKLIFIGAPAFEEKYARKLMGSRLSRLGQREREEVAKLLEKAEKPGASLSLEEQERVSYLFKKSDCFDFMAEIDDPAVFDLEIFQSVWPEAHQLRKKGELLELAARIPCPVVAIHGEQDPHSPKGVAEPLRRAIRDFQMIQLPHCGHYPWLERRARAAFREELEQMLE